MNQAKTVVPRLRHLVELESARCRLPKNSPAGASLGVEIESVRALLPTSILSHHDARRARGKLSIVPVIRGICRACFLVLPRGRLADLHRTADELNVCDHCGAFIYLGDEELAVAPPARKRAVPKAEKAATPKRVSRRADSGEDGTLPSRS